VSATEIEVSIVQQVLTIAAAGDVGRHRRVGVSSGRAPDRSMGLHQHHTFETDGENTRSI